MKNWFYWLIYLIGIIFVGIAICLSQIVADGLYFIGIGFLAPIILRLIVKLFLALD